MAFAIVFRRNVFPAFGGATMRQRWPRPIGDDEVEDAARDLVGRRLHPEAAVRVDRDPLVELDVLRPVLRRLDPLDREDLLDHRALRAAGDRLGLDEEAVLEVLRLDEVLREERVAALGEERLGRDEKAGVVAVELDDAP